MDSAREKSPPSPPMTDSSTKSSSPSLLSTVSASAETAETSPKSPDTLRSLNNKSPYSPSPLPPLPPEVFLSILRFLPPRDQLRACLVSRSWQTFIAGEPQFWTSMAVSLPTFDVDSFQRILFRAIGNGNKKREGLKTLRIKHEGFYERRTGRYEQIIPTELATACLKQVLQVAGQASLTFAEDGRLLLDPISKRYSTLRHLSLDFSMNDIASAHLLNEFARLSGYPILFNLESLSIRAALPNFYLTKTIFFIAPNLRSLVLRFLSPHRGGRYIDTGTWYWDVPHQRNDPRIYCLDQLEELVIEGARIGEEIALPAALPRLRRLVFTKVSWEGKGIFRLLRIARHTLQHLELDHFSFDGVSDEAQDYLDNVDIRDPLYTDGHKFVRPQHHSTIDYEDPAPIVFPVLDALTLTGSTPPLFSDLIYTETDHDMEEYSTPVFHMPRLRIAKFDEIALDPEFLEYDLLPPLVVFGRHARNVENLSITSCQVSDPTLFSCIAKMSARLTHLDIYDNQITDSFLMHLPGIAPSLRVIDLRGCWDVSCQGAARLVERIREIGDEGQYGVEEVWIESPDHSYWENKAHRWMDYVGVLRRNPEDFEGPGPQCHEVDRRKWIKEGKKDSEWEWIQRRVEREAELAKWEESMRLWEERHAVKLGGGGGGPSSSSSRSIVGGSNQLPCAVGSSSSTSGFAPPRPPPHSKPENDVVPLQTQIQPLDVFTLPKLPEASAQPHGHPTSRYEVPTVMPQLTSASDSTVAQSSSAATKFPNGQAPVQSQESKLDITSLDAMNDFNDLDPALIKEQQLALEQIEKSRHHHRMVRGGSGSQCGGGGFFYQQQTEEEAIEAARKQAKHDRWIYEDLGDRERDQARQQQQQQHQQQLYAVTGIPAGVAQTTVPSTDSRMAGLETVRSRGGFAQDEEEEWEEMWGSEVDEDEYASGYESDIVEDSSNETDAVHPNTL